MLRLATSAGKTLVALQEQMLRIRILEDRLQRLCDKGVLAADLHMSTGQEAVAVGVCSVLGENDLVVCHHRMISWAVSLGIPLRALVAEFFGKAEGICGGRSGEMHMQAMQYRLAHTFQLVGTVVPVAAGVAWGLKNYEKNGGIAVAVFGDAATANAQWQEGVNLAAVQQVPLLLVCENNHIAGNVRQNIYLPTSSVMERADGYGINAAQVDGNDVEMVMEVAGRAIAYVRQEQRPFLLDCDTTRLGRHKQGMGDLRSKEEMAALALRDPLRNAIFTLGVRESLQAEIEGILTVLEVNNGSA